MRFYCEKLSIESNVNNDYTLDGELHYPKEKKILVETGPKLTFLVV